MRVGAVFDGFDARQVELDQGLPALALGVDRLELLERGVVQRRRARGRA